MTKFTKTILELEGNAQTRMLTARLCVRLSAEQSKLEVSYWSTAHCLLPAAETGLTRQRYNVMFMFSQRVTAFIFTFFIGPLLFLVTHIICKHNNKNRDCVISFQVF